jgi:hypothetical protein
MPKMPKLKNKQKCYVIVGDKNYTYGAFPLTPEGLKLAKKHVRKLKKTDSGNFDIKEK